MNKKYSDILCLELGKSYKVAIVLRNIQEKVIFYWFFNNGKVFRDFFKRISHMKMGLIAIIAGGIIIIAIISVLILLPYEKSDVVEIDLITSDKEIEPVETPEIQKRLDEIQKIANEADYKPLAREWQTSGPFQIDRSEYAIGEKIFIRIGGLELDDIGQIAVMRPLNATYYSVYITIPFDGAKKAAFNYYVEPGITKIRKICSVDDLMGKWSLVFRGTNYPNLYFNITERIVPGTNTETVC